MSLFKRYYPVLVAVLVAVLPLGMNTYWTEVAVNVGLYALLALSLNVILGQAGIFHMGHAAFYAVGAYVTAILNTHYQIPILLLIPVAGAAAALFALIVARPIIHLRGEGGRSPCGRTTIMIIMARPKTSIRALAKSRNISGRATMRNVPSKTPIWLPPERMTTAKTTTDSQKVNELGEMMVILAAKRFPAMPAQNAPMTKAMSFRCATSMPQPSAAVSSSLMQFNARPKRDSESQWNSSTVSPTMIQMRS